MDETRPPLDTDVATGAPAVSWAAILAGAAAMVATSLTLFALAAGLELASPRALRVTPVASAVVLSATALIVTQWLAALLGGYITGRLRTRWLGMHTHEVFFRDTAHGFITWCVATVFMASGAVAAASTVVGARSHFGGTAADEVPPAGIPPVRTTWSAPAAQSTESIGASVPAPRAYGRLVLPDGPGSAAAVERHQAALAALGAPQWRIRELRVSSGDPDHDEQKDAATGSILTALSMVIGAFIASVSAVLGGRRRDLHP